MSDDHLMQHQMHQDHTYPSDEEHSVLEDDSDGEDRDLDYMDDDEEEQPHEPTNPGLEDLVDTLGTLHIDEKGKTVQFFGPSGGTEVSKSRNSNHIHAS